MFKTTSLALLVAAVFLVVCVCDRKDSTAQAQAAPAAPASPTTKPKELVLDLGNKVTLKLVEIPAGKFLMGSPKDEKDRDDGEGLPRGKWVKGEPRVEVTISKPFYMGVYEVTVDQYKQFWKDSGREDRSVIFPGQGKNRKGDHPVVSVSWDAARAFCQWLSKKTGKTVVLPTEAQWEYACRAGTQTSFGFGDKYEDLGDYAWHFRNSGRTTHPVGQKKPNAWGLYDMHGNVWEWCADYLAEGYAGAGADPAGPEYGRLRVERGGSWYNDPWRCRSAYRGGSDPDGWYDDLGFRVAVSAGVDSVAQPPASAPSTRPASRPSLSALEIRTTNYLMRRETQLTVSPSGLLRYSILDGRSFGPRDVDPRHERLEVHQGQLSPEQIENIVRCLAEWESYSTKPYGSKPDDLAVAIRYRDKTVSGGCFIPEPLAQLEVQLRIIAAKMPVAKTPD